MKTPIIGFAAGLGGRDITIQDIKRAGTKALAAARGPEEEFEFLTLRKEIL